MTACSRGVGLICMLAGVLSQSLVVSAAERPPNIVLILADDLGWIDPACYGNPFHETPHIDRLAAGGMRFTDAYAACPVCSPTRASLLTGRYPATIGLTDFIPGHRRPWARLTVPEFHQQLPLDEVTIAEALRPAGYISAAFGKWHLGGPEHEPLRQGFDEQLVTSGRHFFPNVRTSPPLDVPDGAYLADVLTSQAEAFLERHRARPFFLYLAHYAVHIPLEADDELIAKYRAKLPKPAGRVNHPVYAAMVEHVDRSVGRIVAKLDALGLSENTLLIFFSDNGGLNRSANGGEEVMVNTPLRDEKGSLYEGGIRVPLIVRWPGRVPAGTVCDEPVSSVDLLPTFAEFAGAAAGLTNPVDGVSLRPLLEQTGPLAPRALFWHYPHYHHTTPAGAIRAGDWKLIEYFEDGRAELFHLADDLSETTDLAGRFPDRVNGLRCQLNDWRTRVGARLPTVNPDFDPARADRFQPRGRAARNAAP